MSFTNRVSEVMYPLASFNADSQGIATVNGAYVSLANYHRAFLFIDVGDMAGTATLDVLLQQATNLTGGGVKAIAGKAITQLTPAGGDSNQVLCIELRTEELDVPGGFDCIRYQFTVAAANVELGVHLFGCEPRFAPVPTTNWTEIID